MNVMNGSLFLVILSPSDDRGNNLQQWGWTCSGIKQPYQSAMRNQKKETSMKNVNALTNVNYYNRAIPERDVRLWSKAGSEYKERKII